MRDERGVTLLALLRPELLGAVVKQLLVHFHEQLQSVVDKPVDCPATQYKKR